MKKHVLVKLVGILILLGVLLPTQQKAAHALGCASPLTPGHWAGSFGALTEVKQPDDPFTIDTTIHYGADIDLNIACDGMITGKIFTKAGSTGDTTSDFVHGTWKYSLTDPQDIMDESATCDLTVNWQVLTGKVSAGDGGAPRIDWKFKTGFPGADCRGDDAIVNLMKNVAQGTKDSPTFAQRDVTWQAKATDWSPDHAGSDVPWDDPIGAPVISMLQKGGASVTQIDNWSISLVGATPTVAPTITATPGKQQKAPIVSFVHGQLKEFFLEKIPSVTNNYSADIDWQGADPGTVTFQLDNAAPINGEVNGNSAAAAIRIDNLTAGQNHTLTVTAISSGGMSQSAPFTINIIAVPPWAQPYNLQAENPGEGAGSILYQHSTTKNLPPQPFEALLTIPDIVPFVGGSWGLKQTQFQTGMSVDSLGNASNTAITGFGGFTVAGRDIPIEVNQQTSIIQTRIVNNQLQFVTAGNPDELIQPGTVNFKLPDQALFTRKLSLLEIFPGLSTLLDSGKVGKFIKQFDLSVFQVDISAELSGKGKLGVPGNEVTLIGGSATMGINAVADVAPSLFGLVSGGIQGNLHGTATFDLSLPPNFTDCSLDGSIFLKYSVIGFGSGTYPSDPSATTLASCAAFKSGRSGPFLLSPPAADNPGPLTVSPRPSDWKPEEIVAAPTKSGDAVDGTGTTRSTLVQNANALLAAPSIAGGPNGRMAMAWVSEAPDRPRPQAWHIALRLFDGKSWGQPISLGSGADPAYSPSVAFDGNGQIVVAWVQGSGGVLATITELTDDALRTLGIAYAQVDPASGGIRKSGTLAADGSMGFAPQLATGKDGSVWLAWESSPGAWFVAPGSSPNLLKTSRWDGLGWLPIEQVSADFAGVTSWRLAARDAQNALVVAAQVSGSSDVIAFEHTTGGWLAQQRLASGLDPDMTPEAAYDSDGKEVAVWSDGSDITGLIGDLKVTPSLWLTSESRLLGLVPGADGSLSLLLSGTSGPGKKDIFLSTYSRERHSWSGPDIFAEDVSAPLTVQAAGGEDGSLAAILLQPIWQVGSSGGSRSEGPDLGQLPDLASIDLMRTRPTDSQASSASTTIRSFLDGSILLPIGGAAVVVLLLAGGAVLVLRVRRVSSQ